VILATVSVVAVLTAIPARTAPDTSSPKYFETSSPDRDRSDNRYRRLSAIRTLGARRGSLSSYETIVLLTVEENMDSLHKAGQVEYRAPALRTRGGTSDAPPA
jgi:hypothetical protein